MVELTFRNSELKLSPGRDGSPNPRADAGVRNNSYLGLIRQAQRAFDIGFRVSLEFENLDSPELGGYGVDQVKVVEGLGCAAIRVTDPGELGAAFAQAKKLAAEFQVPVVVCSRRSWSASPTSRCPRPTTSATSWSSRRARPSRAMRPRPSRP